MARNKGLLRSTEHYQVRYPVTDGHTYGIARMHTDEAEFNRHAARGDIVVDHAVLPGALVLPEHELTDIPYTVGSLGHMDPATRLNWGGSEYNDYITLTQMLATIRSDRAPQDRLAPGQMFYVGVGDGMAYYVVTEVKRVYATISWRGFSGDRWVDRMFGYGGKFRIADIDAMAGRARAGVRIFGNIDYAPLFPEKLRSFEARFGHIPPEVTAEATELGLI
jgi:hypothetical protein